MLRNKRLVLPGIGIAVVAALAVAIGVVAVSAGDGSDGGGGPESVRAGDSAGTDPATDGLAMCAEDVPDCNDMIVNPDGDVTQEPSDPEDPVTSDPVTSIDDIDPAQCNLVHNIDACQIQATDAAIKDLVSRLGIQPEQVDLLSAELTQWPDACLGIARPDTACAEVITTGFKIILEHGGTEYEYHTDALGTQVLLVE